MYALSTLATYAMSLAYHADPSPAYQALDMSMNVLNGVVHSAVLLVLKNYAPVACLSLAAVMYAITRKLPVAWHAALVHVPVFLGFSLLL